MSINPPPDLLGFNLVRQWKSDTSEQENCTSHIGAYVASSSPAFYKPMRRLRLETPPIRSCRKREGFLRQQRMRENKAERFGMTPDKPDGDTIYRSVEMLGWLVEERGIAPHIPVRDKSKRTDGTFSRKATSLTSPNRMTITDGLLARPHTKSYAAVKAALHFSTTLPWRRVSFPGHVRRRPSG